MIHIIESIYVIRAWRFYRTHNDMNEHRLSPVNIALNHPKGCMMKMAHHGTVPFKEGEAYLLM